MEKAFDFSNVPHQYPMCLNRECPRSTTCLRQLAEQSAPADIQLWVFVNPKYLDTLEGDCPLYRPDRKVRFAKGFVRILEDLPHKQMKTVITHLIAHFGQRTYYRIRKGERLMSPSEQKFFYNTLTECGVSPSCEFDAYVEDYDW